MGLSCSCPLAIYFDFENSFESVISKSANLGNDDQKMPTHSISLENERSEPKILRSSSSKKLTNESSIRFRTRKIQHIEGPNDDKYVHRDILSPLSRQGSSIGKSPRSQLLDPNSPKHEAAIKLQKVYKSFRTRRKLADCAVLVEQSWWKLLDFAELKHSSISFFDIEKHETAISRWSRARTRAAKVGKGLSQNEKAQKLALQHWLEAIDPRHRYGHNLHFYYKTWLNSQSKEPFFYWLDIGEGKEINLVEKCPRSTLQTQCIKYLGPMERMAYEVAVVDGKLLYKESGKLLNTIDEPKGCKWIFVLSTSRTLYVGKKTKGLFQHSSFLAGGATLAAGRIVAERGVLKAVWPHSGHYRPTPENFQDFKSFLIENSVDLTSVKLVPIDDEEESISKRGSAHFRSISSEEDLVDKAIEAKEEANPHKHENDSIQEKSHGFLRKLTTLKIPSNDDFLEMLKSEREATESIATDENYMSEETTEEIITGESVFRRINSHKDSNSYQLGKQLSCKWSTGAGPRISCLRDYPSGLQNHALEQVSLSPRSNRRLRFELHSQASTPTSIDSNLSRHNSRNSRSVYSADNAVMHSSV